MIADGLVIATGAVLSEDMEKVVAFTAAAVELVRLPQARDTPTAEDGNGAELPRRLVLSGEISRDR